MDKPRIILGATLVALAGIGLFASQRAISISPGHQSAGTHTAMSMFAPLHHDCAASQDANATAKSHVSEHVAQTLELTAAQLADIDRMSAELCQAVTKAHERMMNTLTPEQREKIAKLHEGDHASGIHALMKKLHGGGR